jgi:hypothetical protein
MVFLCRKEKGGAQKLYKLFILDCARFLITFVSALSLSIRVCVSRFCSKTRPILSIYFSTVASILAASFTRISNVAVLLAILPFTMNPNRCKAPQRPQPKRPLASALERKLLLPAGSMAS